jgi:hypothetical protein
MPTRRPMDFKPLAYDSEYYKIMGMQASNADARTINAALELFLPYLTRISALRAVTMHDWPCRDLSVVSTLLSW